LTVSFRRLLGLFASRLLAVAGVRLNDSEMGYRGKEEKARAEREGAHPDAPSPPKGEKTRGYRQSKGPPMRGRCADTLTGGKKKISLMGNKIIEGSLG